METKAKLKLEIYTMFSTPFALGGVQTPKKTEVDVQELGEVKGVMLYGFETPRGNFRVAEPSGGIVGDSFEQVKGDLEGASDEMIKGQLEWSKKQANLAELISNEDFFKVYK